MKKTTPIFGFIFLMLSLVGWGQNNDTTTVQLFDFSDITKRKDWFVLPPDTTSYEKILMYYTLKCDPQTTQDGYNCGEWDYTTFTNLYQYENIGDTVYRLGINTPDTIFYSNTPSYNVYQSKEYLQLIDTINSESQFPIVIGNITSNDLIGSDKTNTTQYLLKASDLLPSGLSAGAIQRLKITLDGIARVDHFTIKMKNTLLNEVTPDTFEKEGFTTVYKNSLDLNSGDNIFNFTTPFIWDGSSNIILEFSHNSTTGITTGATSTTVNYNSGINCGSNYCLEFSGDDYVSIPPAAFDQLNDEITISFWNYGNSDLLPMNAYTVEGRDSNNRRVLNLHLPWSDDKVYWDCGNSGTNSYDRISTAINASQYSGQWNHWAFTKNANSGEMTIFFNGTVLATQNGKNKTLGDISRFKIGGRAANELKGDYEGKIDEFRVWDKALTQAEIQAYMYKSINNTHPQIAHLILAYAFDETSGTSVEDYSGNNWTGRMMGYPARRIIIPSNHYFNFSQLMSLPALDLYQGTYSSHVDSSLVYDTLINSPISIVKDISSRDISIPGLSYQRVDTVTHYPFIDSYTFDFEGNIINTIPNSISGFYTNSIKKITHQLQNYVTPYGIGLDLGPNGFRWVYDITDYEPILHDTVEILAGNQQELIDLKFLYIKGTPPREVKQFETIWDGRFQHSDIANDNVLKPVDKTILPDADQVVVRTRTTGHWFGGFQNCAEFCPKTHHIKVNGTQTHSWLNWKECSKNPVQPQGGTWVYDRAGWCPGDFADTYDHDITSYITPNSTTSIDYGMETTAGGMEGNYIVSVQLLQYGPPNFETDARVEDILAPNDWEFYQHFNPICNAPKIKIRNTGANEVSSVKIGYWVCGGPIEFYTWTGNLSFMDTVSVELPIPDQSFWDHTNYCNLFHAEIFEVNGSPDDYPSNNHQQTTFDSPPSIPGDLIIWYRSNNSPNENDLYLYDDQGNIIYENTAASASTWYKDTVALSPGCYKLVMTDLGEDGLSFFANPNQGSGSLRIRKMGGGTHKIFNPNFGSEIIYYFTSGYTVNTEELGEKIDAKLYPNPNDGLFTVETEGILGPIELEVYDNLGAQIKKVNYTTADIAHQQQLDLSNLPRGSYTLRIVHQQYAKVLPLIKL